MYALEEENMDFWDDPDYDDESYYDYGTLDCGCCSCCGCDCFYEDEDEDDYLEEVNL